MPVSLYLAPPQTFVPTPSVAEQAAIQASPVNAIGLIHDEMAEHIEPMRRMTDQDQVCSTLGKPNVQPHASSKRKADHCSSPRAVKTAHMQHSATSTTALPSLHVPQKHASPPPPPPPLSTMEQMVLIKLSLSHGTATGLGDCCERLFEIFCRKRSPSDVALAVTHDVTTLVDWFRQLSQFELRPRNTQLATASKAIAALVKIELSRHIQAAVGVEMVRCIIALLAMKAPVAPDDAVETPTEELQYMNIEEEDALSELDDDDAESSIIGWNQHVGRLFVVLLELVKRKDPVAAMVKQAVQSPTHLRSVLSALAGLQFHTMGWCTQLSIDTFADGDYRCVSASATWNGVRVLLACDIFSAGLLKNGPTLSTLQEGGAIHTLLAALVLFGRDRRWLSFTSDRVFSDAYQLALAVELFVEHLPIKNSLVSDDFRLMMHVINPIHVYDWRKSYDIFPHPHVLRVMAKIVCRPVCDPWWKCAVVRFQGEALVLHILTRVPGAGMRSLSNEETALVVKILHEGSNRLAVSPELYERHRAAPGLGRLMQIKTLHNARDAAISFVPNQRPRFFV